MVDYKSVYYKMFNKITDIIEELKILQIETEEIFIESAEDDANEYEKKESF